MANESSGQIVSSFETLGDRALAIFYALFPLPEPPMMRPYVPPPPMERPLPPLPMERPLPPPPGFLLGYCVDQREALYALGEELDRHMLLVGATGCGKTTLICRYFDQEVQKWQ